MTHAAYPALGQHLDRRAIQLWRVHAALRTLVSAVIAFAGFGGVAFKTAGGLWLMAGLLLLVLVQAVLTIGILPRVRYRTWRYELRDQELELQQGWFVIERTLVPLIRVQHVDTRQGPLARYFGLSSVTVNTAATTHEIPALADADALRLRDHISNLARTARESL